MYNGWQIISDFKGDHPSVLHHEISAHQFVYIYIFLTNHYNYVDNIIIATVFRQVK